ncbi:MAG: hypothetical protein H6R11_1147, partial [Proteobacteria bacterium]|nr:hypothetical protein [Pseudomonadota bacterium]
MQGTLGGREIARFAGEMAEALQRQNRDAVTGGRGVVVPRLGAVNQPLMIVAGEEETAAVAILELIEQDIRQVFGPLQFSDPEIRLEQIQQGAEQERVVVDIGVQVGTPVLVRGEQPVRLPVGLPQRAANEIQGPARRGQPVRALEHGGGAGHAF